MKQHWHTCPICNGQGFLGCGRYGLCWHCGGDGCVLVVEIPDALLADVMGVVKEQHETEYWLSIRRAQVGDLYAKITQAAKRLKEVRE